MLDLGLIRAIDKKFVFNQTNPNQIAPEIIMFALLDYCEGETTISFDKLQEIALIFCLSVPDLIILLQQLAYEYRDLMMYTDNAGIKNVQFKGALNKMDILDKYYQK